MIQYQDTSRHDRNFRGTSVPRPTTGPFAALALLGLAVLLLSLSGCAGEPPKQTRTEFVLGTAVSVTTYGRVDDEVFDEVFARVTEIEEKMSTSTEDYSDTELLAVNAAAGDRAVAVSPDTFSVVERALEFSRVSGGVFDVTIHPLVRLWGIGTEDATIPDEGAIERTLDSVDYTAVELDAENRSIGLPKPGMGIDVGGIAKGYAADEAAAILREAGVESALLDFGGNILTVGRKPDGSPWRIGIQVPDARRGQSLGIATVASTSVVTSGTYERFFEQDGTRYHHILDTETGYPVRNGLDSVTIITANSMDADALSTTAFALGLERGFAFIDEMPEVEGIFVTEDRRVITTPGAVDFFELTNDDYRLSSL